MNKSLKRTCGVIFCVLIASATFVSAQISSGSPDTWSAAERAVLKTLHIDTLPVPDGDPSNAFEHAPKAVALGKKIFFDTRFSANQKISCASCHIPQQQFQDGRPLGQGIATGLRRTMPIAGSGYGAWQFWDGRKDSLWAQALGPMEDAREHGGNRMAFAKIMSRHYREEYEALFGAFPALNNLPENASPIGNAKEREAWENLDKRQRQDVSRIFANIGKAIAAYEKTLRHGPSRVDNFIAGTLRGDPAAAQLLTASEKRGLRLFVGKAECVSCHNGPLFTDQHFHNTGVMPRDPKNPDFGRSAAIASVLRDEFNCLGPFSDAKRHQCQELDFIATNDPHMVGAFKTPSLRNVALRPPYMHAGQIQTLEEVVQHYADAPRSAVGRNERKPVSLSKQEMADLVQFLQALSGAIHEGQQIVSNVK